MTASLTVFVQTAHIGPHMIFFSLLNWTGVCGLSQAIHGRQDGGEKLVSGSLQNYRLSLNKQQGVS